MPPGFSGTAPAWHAAFDTAMAQLNRCCDNPDLAECNTKPAVGEDAGSFAVQNRPVGEFADWAATSGVRVLVGDFNGDGKADLALVRQEGGWNTVPVALAR